MKVPIFKSLKFRMPLFILAAIVPLMLVAITYASERAAKTIRQEAKEDIKLQTKMLADSVTKWEEANIITLINLSLQPDIISMNPEEQKPVLKTLTDQYKHFYLAMTVNENGWNVARNDNNKLKYYGNQDYVIGAMAGNRITRETLISRTNNKPALAISTPIREKNGNKIIGAAIIATNLEELSRQVGQLKFGKTGYAFIVDESGMVLAHPDPEYTSGARLKDLIYFPPVRSFLANKNNQVISYFTDLEGKNWISYYVRIDNNWGIIVNQEKREFFKNERQFIILAISIAIVTIIGVIIVTWLVAERAIAPIYNLSNAASAIANGEWNNKIKINRQDELGVLATSFDRMTLQLKILFKNLQKRIEQKTERLDRAKQMLQKAEETANSARQARDRFMTNVSHELLDPLTIVIGYTKIVKYNLPRSSNQLEKLKIIEENGNYLLGLINDILYFSENKSYKIELIENEFELANYLEGVLELVRYKAEEKKLQLVKEFNNLPQFIRADERKLRQVLTNLLSNAIKFSDKGRITLRISALDFYHDRQQKLRFEVSDTGIGISPQELNTIFQPFEQIGDLDYKSVGTGLSLSISKKLVELMGGKLKVHSQVRYGSTFWFEITVPVISKPKAIAPEVIINRITTSRGAKPKILVVDDKQVNRDILVKILQPKGFEIFTANNGQEMLKAAASIQPDLIFLDLFMPIKTGFVSARELRQDPQLKHIPLIIVTASSITKEMSDYLGCDAVLQKPIQEKELTFILHQYLTKISGSASDLAM